jgi:hypothetical protein
VVALPNYLNLESTADDDELASTRRLFSNAPIDAATFSSQSVFSSPPRPRELPSLYVRITVAQLGLNRKKLITIN